MQSYEPPEDVMNYYCDECGVSHPNPNGEGCPIPFDDDDDRIETFEATANEAVTRLWEALKYLQRIDPKVSKEDCLESICEEVKVMIQTGGPVQ